MNTTSRPLQAVSPKPSLDVRTASGEQDDEIDLLALFSLLWRGKWWITFCVLCAVTIGAIYAFAVAVPKYRSVSVVMLETEQANIVDLESVMGGMTGDSMEVNSEIEVLRSRSLMGKVVDRLDLTTDPEFNSALKEPGLLDRGIDGLRRALGQDTQVSLPAETEARRSRDRAINGLLDMVSVTNVRQSLVFQISVITENPEKSALIADTIAELYILEQLEVKFEASEQATQWLSGRVAELKVQLEQAETEVAAFNASIDLVSVEALQLQEAQLKDIRDRVSDAREAALLAERRFEALQGAETRADQAELAGDTRLSRLLQDAEDDPQSAEVFDARFGEVLDRARVEVTRTGQQVAALVASEQQVEELISRQNRDLITLQQLTREAEAVRLLYETFLRRLQEMSAQQGLHQADSRVLSSAVIPLEPSEPRPVLVLVLSALLGLIFAVALLILREMRQTGFRTAEDLRNFAGYTVLGQIPALPSRKRKRALSYVLEKPASSVAEAYRNLRTSLMLANLDNPPQVILSTSCVPGEGKTMNALALAQSFTGLGKKVLLIEGDIRRRTFNEYFDNIPEKGLVSVLSGEIPLEDALLQDTTLKASVLAGEKSSANAADIFASQRFKTLINDMRGQFDVIIIDTPPVLVVPDARIIAESADAIIFTVKWDNTTRSQVEEAMQMFHSAGQRITGFVLSQINARRLKAYGYGGRHGAYAAYGSQYYDN